MELELVEKGAQGAGAGTVILYHGTAGVAPMLCGGAGLQLQAIPSIDYVPFIKAQTPPTSPFTGGSQAMYHCGEGRGWLFLAQQRFRHGHTWAWVFSSVPLAAPGMP